MGYFVGFRCAQRRKAKAIKVVKVVVKVVKVVGFCAPRVFSLSVAKCLGLLAPPAPAPPSVAKCLGVRVSPAAK